MSRGQRPADRTAVPDQRRTKDRRAVIRDGDGRARGRRATDLADLRAGASSDRQERPVRKRRATSDGRQPLVVYLRPEAIKALKFAALDGDTTASAIVAGAVDSWLRGNGRGPKR